ncbi:MAG: efflux RND transporter periplasmic adaptor subunit [Acidobacteria bacterium]|nr:efflux RND transporter periplasmic adaptor subunit [Acidobacteriota bacterium]
MMKNRWKVWMALGAILALAACSGEKASEKAKPVGVADTKPGSASIDPNSPQLAQIRTEAVQMMSVPVGNVAAPGKVEANMNRLSHVVLPVTGRVNSVLVKMGDFVRQGQALLTLESADVDAAVSVYQQAQATITQAKSALAKAQMDLDRSKDLFEHGAVPQKDVLNAQAVVVQAQASVEQAQAASEQSRRRLQILGVGTDAYGQKVTIHAPISGKLLEMSVVNGEFRNDLSAPLMTIADLSSVWVTSDVPETAIRFIRLGEPVNIELTAYPGETFRGRVTLIGDTVDPQTRTLKVRAELANPDGRLKPEMFGKIQLAEENEQKPTVPSAAIISADGQILVWREVGEGVFEKVTIRAGAQVGDRIAVLEGLKPEDRVVVDGVMLLSAR